MFLINIKSKRPEKKTKMLKCLVSAVISGVTGVISCSAELNGSVKRMG